MMMQGSAIEVITVFISAFIGVAIISSGFQGWLFWTLNFFERAVFVAAGMLMFIPGTMTDIIGIAVAAALLLLNLKKWERGPKFLMQRRKK